MFDCAVIGGGPAGVSAVINLKLLGKSFIWFASRSSSEKVERASLIQNYIGLPSVTGEQLSTAFSKHLESFGISPRTDVVTGIYETDGYFTLLAADKDYTAKTVILCTGVETSKPVEGEAEFLGRGVSYCATCDGFLYKGKKIAVYCTDKSFEHEAEYLLELAGEAVLIPLYKNCEIKKFTGRTVMKKPVKISGDMRVRSIEFSDESIEVDGVFILRGFVSPSTLLKGLKTEGGHIVTDRSAATSVAGVFAAGDCTGRPYQYAKAVGEGNVAAHSAVEYIAENA